MSRTKHNRIAAALEAFAVAATEWSGRSSAFVLAVLVIVVWLITGPIFRYSDTWQLVINTGTTVVTFLMVFLIQRAQNKEALATQLKLNELVAAMEGASNRLIGVESLSEDDLQTLRKHYLQLATMAAQAMRITESHSIEEAETRHQHKHAPRRRPA